jgi:hypothetical protein
MRWRRAHPVLVVEAHTTGAIAVIRSLGRAGHPVHAVSFLPSALGLLSRFASATAVCPRYDDPAFLPWLRAYVAAQQIAVIIPSESLLLAVRPAIEEFLPLLPFGRDPDLLYAGMSKFDLFDKLAGAPNLPPTLLVKDTLALPSAEALAALGTPLYVKSDGSHSTVGERGGVCPCSTAEEAREEVARMASRFSRLLVQGHVGGQGVGAFFLIWRGEVLCEFMHRRLHEVPHTGGVSSLRESWFHAQIRDDALQKLIAMGWEGVAMMEYRHEPQTGRFHFLEMNGRFWGSLHLALQSQVDFPRLLVDAFLGHPERRPARFPLGVRVRHTFPMEVQYVWSRLKDRTLPAPARAWSVLEFFLLVADPRVRSDLLFPGDERLYWESMRRFVGSMI